MHQEQFVNCPTSKNINQHFQQQLIQLRLDPRSPQQRLQLMLILNSYLSYPDDYLANNHRYANKLGRLDLSAEERLRVAGQDSFVRENMRETRIIKCHSETCRCCGFFIQEEDISTCQLELDQIMHLGVSTRVFYKTFTYVVMLLTVMLVIYSIFAFVTNITTAKSVDYLNQSSSSFDYLSISLGAKSRESAGYNSDGQKYYQASSWLGLVMLIIWSLLFLWIRRQIKIIQNRRNTQLGISDYSIVIENMPTDFTGEELEQQLNEYLRQIKEEDFNKTIKINQLKVVKYNEGKPFYLNEDEFADQELVQIHSESNQLKDKIANYVLQFRRHGKFVTPNAERTYTYSKFKESQRRKLDKYNEIVGKLRAKINAEYHATRTVVFVTFLTHQQRQFIIQHNKNSLIYKLKRFLQFWKKSDYFSVHKGDVIYDDITIERPPEPEDINWGNLGLTTFQKFCRFCFTILATILMIGISFIIVYALSTVQRDNQKKRFISVIISLAISVINLLIIKVIQFMTLIEKAYSMNNYQISIAIKSIIAQSMNSIFVPIMVNYYIKNQNIFGVSGLAEDIFILAAASSFLPPIIKIIDPWNILLNLRYKFYHDQVRRLYLSQFQLNEISEKMQFQIGLQYIYIIHNFIFICFFVSLQPIIALFGIVGAGLMYWIEKYALLSRCQRPVPGPDNITAALYQILFFGPLAFALGSLTWSWFLPDQSFRSSLIPNLISLGLALIMFFFPYDLFVERQIVTQNKNYFEKRIYFTTEYDRLNPSTSRQAIQQYRKFLYEKKMQLQGVHDPGMQDEMRNNFMDLEQHNIYKPAYMNKFRTNQEDLAIQQLLYNQSRNVVNPLDLLNNLMPKQGGMSYTVQPPRNPMNQLFTGRRATSNRQLSHNFGPPPEHAYPQTSSKFLADNNMTVSIERNHFNDDFKNLYKSNIRLDEMLGQNSNKFLPQSSIDPRIRQPGPNTLAPIDRREPRNSM